MLTDSEESAVRDLLARLKTNSFVGTPLRGGLPLIPQRTALPTASADFQGLIIYIPGASGVADGAYICEKAAAGSYSWVPLDTNAGAGLTAVDFLVGTATGLLSGEIAVGTTPGGELGGTWASPTVDATHSGSAHHSHSGSNNNSSASPTMTTALTTYDITGASVTLVTGTWLLIRWEEVQIATATGNIWVYIRSGASTIEASAIQAAVPNGQEASLTAFALVTPAGSTTYKMSATASQNGCTFVNATLTAVKLA